MIQTSLSDAYLQRFAGIGRLYGQQALRLFARSRFCVVGIGGVGSWAAEALARTGIGAITLIDMDDVCITNTNRQIHAMQGTVGQPKIEVMRSGSWLSTRNVRCIVRMILSRRIMSQT